jgi:hypothetical protein
MKSFSNQAAQNQAKANNPLEFLKDVVKSTPNEMKKEATAISEDFLKGILGIDSPIKKDKYSVEIPPGEAVNMSEVRSGKYEDLQKARKQAFFERTLLQEEKALVEKRSNELRLQLKALQEEVSILAKQTRDLGLETEIAIAQSPPDPGIYHVRFLEKLLEFIKSFRKKIEEGYIWLHMLNNRSRKKNLWLANFKKKGSSYLLSSEHYLQRSAG